MSTEERFAKSLFLLENKNKFILFPLCFQALTKKIKVDSTVKRGYTVYTVTN